MAAETDADRLPAAAVLAEWLRAPFDGSPPPVDAASSLAAVLILLHDVDGAPNLILTRRADHLLHHPGQVSLPGGRFDPGDVDLASTALRETWEEVGVDADALELVRRQPTVHTRVSGFLVVPFVGVAVAPIDPVPCDDEIARIMHVPVSELLLAHHRLPPSPTIATLRYPLDGEDVWGATARILADFSRDVLASRARPGG